MLLERKPSKVLRLRVAIELQSSAVLRRLYARACCAHRDTISCSAPKEEKWSTLAAMMMEGPSCSKAQEEAAVMDAAAERIHVHHHPFASFCAYVRLP